jgi:hypothetical protein
MLILLRIPFYGANLPISHIHDPLGMILPLYLVTVCKFSNQILSDLTGKNAADFYVNATASCCASCWLQPAYLNSVRTISKAVDLLEDRPSFRPATKSGAAQISKSLTILPL